MPEIHSLGAFGFLRCVQILDWVYKIYQERQHLILMGWEWALKWPENFCQLPTKGQLYLINRCWWWKWSFLGLRLSCQWWNTRDQQRSAARSSCSHHFCSHHFCSTHFCSHHFHICFHNVLLLNEMDGVLKQLETFWVPTDFMGVEQVENNIAPSLSDEIYLTVRGKKC